VRSERPLGIAYRLAEPFCDYLGVTVPKGDGPFVLDALKPFLDVLGAKEVSPGLYRAGEGGGTFKHSERGQVAVFGASGQIMAGVRSMGSLPEFCMAFASRGAHRITRLDAACDYSVDAPPLVRSFYRVASAGGIQISRKTVAGHDVRAELGLNFRGEETGTVYIGARHSRVLAVLYDKQWERVSRGLSDPGPMLRVELRIKAQCGATLRDVVSPERVFYHYAAPDICKVPSGVGDWSPNAEGFVLPERHEFTPAERMSFLARESTDVRRLFELAATIGPEGFPMLQRELLARWKRFTQGGMGQSPIEASVVTVH